MIDFRNVDCMELMAEYDDNHFDLAIVDPPYGIDASNMQLGKGSGTESRTWENKDWDKLPPSKEYFDELFRVSKNQIIWGANYYEGMKPTPCWVIWDKMQEFSGAVFEMAWTSFKTPAKAFRMSRAEAYCNTNKVHPTQKPIKLYTWILAKYANEGDKILDTHVGSASSLIACHKLGFDVTGSELDEEYYSLAQQRILDETAQLSLF